MGSDARNLEIRAIVCEGTTLNLRTGKFVREPCISLKFRRAGTKGRFTRRTIMGSIAKNLLKAVEALADDADI